MALATLDGFPILDGAISWSMRAGAIHGSSEFEMMPADARSLVAGGLRPVVLRIESPGAPGIEIRDLYVVFDRPGPNPHVALVRVVDRRWFWPRVHVNHSFNMRRNVGVKRVKAGWKAPEIDPLLPTVRYAPWSLDNGYPWTAEAALRKVWETVQEPERETTGITAQFVVDPDIAKLTGDSLPLEDIEIADDGAAAFKRILDFIPGASVTVDADGTVRVYSVASGGERATFDALLPEQEGGGHAELVSNSRDRPSEVRVFFAPEAEMRFDFEEEGGGSAGTVARSPRREEDPWVENVLPVPDYSLDVPGVGTVAQGTYITIGQALAAWGEIPNFGTLTYTAIRRALVPYIDLWTGVRIAGLGDAKADWASRIASVQQHFRRTYRINQRVVRRVRSIRAYRVATINVADGSRAPASAYQDWAVVATQRFLSVRFAGGADDFAYCHNFIGYPATGKLDDTRSAAPVEVSVVDADQGILRLEFKQDVYRTHEQMLPSQVTNIPTGDLLLGLIAWNSFEPGGALPELKAGHKVIVVLTVVPAAPNSKKRLFRMVRRPSDVAGILPTGLSGGLSDARGPPMDVFVGPGWETARIAWADDHRSRILKALGFDAAESEGDVSTLADLVVNVESQDSLGGSAASLDAIANSIAAAVYAGFSDRVEGERTSHVNHEAKVRGFVERVMHRVMPDGEASTTATSMERSSPLDLMSLMPKSTRSVILRLANSGLAVQ